MNTDKRVLYLCPHLQILSKKGCAGIVSIITTALIIHKYFLHFLRHFYNESDAAIVYHRACLNAVYSNGNRKG